MKTVETIMKKIFMLTLTIAALAMAGCSSVADCDRLCGYAEAAMCMNDTNDRAACVAQCENPPICPEESDALNVCLSNDASESDWTCDTDGTAIVSTSICGDEGAALIACALQAAFGGM
jgi:hypothetical protein